MHHCWSYEFKGEHFLFSFFLDYFAALVSCFVNTSKLEKKLAKVMEILKIQA
jgi:hypothetical protein